MQPESMSSSDEAQGGDAEGSGTYAERRKSSKPIMEKRRRARINSSLNELKSILLEALKKDSTRHSKLEKADILEMTVKYLKNVERQRLSVSVSIDPSVVDKYRAGFNECRNEVMRFLSTCEGVTVDVRTSLLNHLASCIQSIRNQSSMFDDGVFDAPPSLQSPFLPNGTSPAIPVRIPDATMGITNLSSCSYAANTPRSSISNIVPGFDSKLAVVHSGNAHATSGPIVLPEGLQLTPAINGLSAGNIAFLLPSGGTGATAAFIAPLTATQNLPTSPDRPVIKVQASPTGSLIHENYKEDQTSPRRSEAVAIQPVLPIQQQSFVVKAAENRQTLEAGASYAEKSADRITRVHTEQRFQAHKTESHQRIVRYQDHSDYNTSFSSSEDPVVSESDRTGSSCDGHEFDPGYNKDPRPTTHGKHHGISRRRSNPDHNYGSSKEQEAAVFPNRYSHFTNIPTKTKKRKTHGNTEGKNSQHKHPSDTSSSKRSRIAASSYSEDNSDRSSSDGSPSSSAQDPRVDYHVTSPSIPLGLNVATSVAFQPIQSGVDANNNTVCHVVDRSPQPIPESVSTRRTSPLGAKTNPWRPWSKTKLLGDDM